MLKTYTGGCHCGAVRFEAQINIAAGTGKCNCTLCAKMRLWSVKVPAAQFRCTSGEASLTDYRGNNPVAHHTFCKHCGVRPFEWVDVPNMSGSVYYNINVACLEGIDAAELLAAPVSYFDGLNDNWGARPEDVRLL